MFSFYGYRCHPGFIGVRCEYADLLAVVATNQRQHTLATILMLGILGSVLLVLLCTIIKYEVYFGYPTIFISCIYLDTVICNIPFMYCVLCTWSTWVPMLVENKVIKLRTAQDKERLNWLTFNFTSTISLVVGGGGADGGKDLCFPVCQKNQMAS